MHHLRFHVAAPPKPAFDVEDATQVTEDDGIRPRIDDLLALVVGHARRDLSVLDRKRPAEPTASLAIRHLDERDICIPGEQRAGLLLHPHLPQARARVVVRDSSGKATRNAVELEHIDQKIGELVGFGAERARSRQQLRIVAKEIGVVGLDHAAARTGWGDQILAFLEFGDDLGGKGFGT